VRIYHLLRVSTEPDNAVLVAIFVFEVRVRWSENIDVDAEATGSVISGTVFAVHQLRMDDGREEGVLWNAERKTLLVPETLGTLPPFRDDGDALGIHPAVEELPQELADGSEGGTHGCARSQLTAKGTVRLDGRPFPHPTAHCLRRGGVPVTKLELPSSVN